MNDSLNQYVQQYGRNALFDTQRLHAALASAQVNPKYIYQLLLALDSGNLKSRLAELEGSVSTVELNTILINTVNLTGLRQRVVQTLLADILTAMGVSFPKQMLQCFDTETGAVSRVEGIQDDQAAEQQLKLAGEILAVGLPDSTERAVEIYNSLAQQGNSEAMYMLGMLKHRELTVEDTYERKLNAGDKKRQQETAIGLLQSSAANGNSKAKTELGDIFYEQGRYDRAYEYYTAPGVMTVNSDTKERVINILNLRRSNLILLVLGGIMVVCLWVFLAFNPASVHNSVNLIGLGIPMSVLSTLVYGAMHFVRFRYKYADLKPFAFAIAALWAVYPLVLAIC